MGTGSLFITISYDLHYLAPLLHDTNKPSENNRHDTNTKQSTDGVVNLIQSTKPMKRKTQNIIPVETHNNLQKS